ncbi:Actin cytoskeleton-regulatory complex protein END3 [Wickerhamiella sorbophila]|uniref:Actin cytoskeleton-regulatory complex protein END3 n=1 Tax=Wickerhamiella sorbophila TaxID=45607 RepID=A0A2T0FQ25_9ASCO|nr:Actin cytoskeleton-regulatory complex protein END3 [Wickerhamiella sorbophila]PRT57080.1 Actin cytoskeleton-regulatory complex protein END3 [Wickerhamiella sorbophila]
MPQLSQEEIAKYWEIFSQQQPANGLLSGDKMFAVLKNSQLEDAKLEKVWDLADIDGDGNMDFEEFCIAMRLVFDLINSTVSSVPSELPEWLIPASKRHLVTAKQALSGSLPTGGSSSDDYDEDMRLSSNFNWYISPQDRRSYEDVYSANADPLGYIAFSSLNELYPTLDIPTTDISSAWNLVNPSSNEKIDKEQCMVFLHMLNQRSNGVRIPRSVPASLRATFGKQTPSYDVNSSQAEIRSSSTEKKGGFADNYLSRLGLGGRSQGYQSQGTDFSATKDTDWEEVRLQRELADLTKIIEDLEHKQAEREQSKSNGGSSSLVRRELQLLLEYKEKQLMDRKKGTSQNGSAGDLRRTQEEIDLIAEQVDSLKEHLRSRQKQLEELKAEISGLA